MGENRLSIGELVKQLSINLKAIRRYGDIKLLPGPDHGKHLK